MRHEEMVALIRSGVTGHAGTWADFGAGSGNFTWALAELLGPEGVIYAVERDRQALQRLRERLDRSPPAATIYPVEADFTAPLDLPPLAGALMANALHFQPHAAQALSQVARYLQPGAAFVLVEYDLARPRSYVPFPIPWGAFPALARVAGLAEATLIGTRRSPSTRVTMYAALARQPCLGGD